MKQISFANCDQPTEAAIVRWSPFANGIPGYCVLVGRCTLRYPRAGEGYDQQFLVVKYLTNPYLCR